MADDEKGGPLEEGANRIRETAKWLTVSLASLGAVLIAGSQLSSLGDLEYATPRFWFAAGSAALAVSATVAILALVIWVATTPVRDLDDLVGRAPRGAEKVLASKTHLAPYASAAALNLAWAAAVEKQTQAAKALDEAAAKAQSAAQAEADAPRDQTKADAALAARSDQAVAQARMNEANDGLAYVRDAGAHLLEVVGYANLAGRWRLAAGWTLVLGVVSALAVGVFAWAANPPEDATGTTANPAVLAKASRVTISLTDEGQQALRSSLGRACKLDGPIHALLLGTTDAGADVVVDNNACRAVRFVAGSNWAAIDKS